MAREIFADYSAGTTGLYAALWNPLDVGKYWNTSTLAFQTYASANWTAGQYKIALSTDYGVGLFAADFPTQITTKGLYCYSVYLQGGASPATTDLKVAQGAVEWAGDARFSIASDVDGWDVVEAIKIILAAHAATDTGSGSSQGKYAALDDAATTRLLYNIVSGKRVVATVNGAG
jgi:hypothetical protein